MDAPSSVTAREPAIETESPAIERPVAAREAAHFFGYLLEIRAESQNVRDAVNKVRAAASLTDVRAREAGVAASLAEEEEVDRRNRGRIAALIERLHRWMDHHPDLHQWCADQVIHIENQWERVEFHLDRIRGEVAGGRAGDSTVLSATLEIERHIDRMIFLIGYLTIPGRVNEHLRQLRIGQALDFHRDFADELPEVADRVALLTTMRSHPAQIYGIVDVDRGVIFKTAATRGRQVLSLVVQIVVWFVLGGLLAAIAYLDYWPELGGPSWLVERYLFVTMGSVTHLALGTLKQRRADTGQTQALDDLLLFIHVREVAIVWTIISIAIGTVGLCLLADEPSVETALLVGYSLDSFIDLFLMRFETRATGVAKALTTSSGKA
ncbi:MAG: hypothetical protein R3B09_07855 [Nannocystaceae bacterium]